MIILSKCINDCTCKSCEENNVIISRGRCSGCFHDCSKALQLPINHNLTDCEIYQNITNMENKQ